MAANEVRIIGGNWKGRKLRFPDASGLRPTLGRVRVTLFNWLSAEIVGSRCLDLFAGSGALGFEALSRGAAAVTLVEQNRRTAQALRDNAARLGAGAACTIAPTSATRFLRQPGPPWDVIFLDPPFDSELLHETLRAIRTANCLRKGGVVYFEMARRAAVQFDGFDVLKESTAGDTRFGLLIATADRDDSATEPDDAAPAGRKAIAERPIATLPATLPPPDRAATIARSVGGTDQ